MNIEDIILDMLNMRIFVKLVIFIMLKKNKEKAHQVLDRNYFSPFWCI